MKFLLIIGASVLGNGLGAWNIRTISSGRYAATALLTFMSASVNMTITRAVTRDVSGYLVFAYAIGSTIGIVGAVLADRKWFHKDFGGKQNEE